MKASCGCTTPRWTQDEIAPGGAGEVQAAYSTRGRPGPFHKTITVQYESSEQPIVLLEVDWHEYHRHLTRLLQQSHPQTAYA